MHPGARTVNQVVGLNARPIDLSPYEQLSIDCVDNFVKTLVRSDMFKRSRSVLAVGAALVIGAPFATAQSTSVSPSYQIPDSSKPADKDGPRAIPLGDGVSLTPYVNFSFGGDDNLYLTNVNKKSSVTQVYNPGLRLNLKGGASQFGLGYDLNAGRYSSSSADNYTDHKLDGFGEFVMTSSMALKLSADYARGHDPRGSTDRVGAASPDRYSLTGGSALFAYGANEAKGRIEVEAGTVDRRYQNNRTSTEGSDRNTDSVAGRFFFKVATKTSLLVEARQAKLDYKLSTSSQDSKETRYLAGVTWDATAATSGTIKVGQIKKDFGVSSRKDFSGTGWEANVAWKPASYSTFDFYTTKSINESTGLGDFTLAKKYGTTWTHGWDSRLKSVVSLSRNNDDFVGNVRADKTDAFGLAVNYKLMRWLTLSGEYNTTKRDSNTSVFDYKRNLYMLKLSATL